MSYPKRTRALRVTDAMHEAVTILANLEERSNEEETRYLIRLGLDQERNRIRKAKLAPNLNSARERFLQLFGESK